MWKNITSEPIIFLYSIVYMINLSILPQFVVKKICLRQYDGNTTLCAENSENITPEMKKEATDWWFIILASAQIPAVFTVLIWGPISDVIGRKKSLLVIPIVSFIQSIAFVLCAHYMTSHLIYVCVAMFLACIFGEFPGVLALSCGFIADVTAGANAKTRMSRMAMVDAAVNLAAIPAGLFAGQLLKQVGFIAVFGLSIGVNVVSFIYIVFLLPDPKIFQLEKGQEMKNDDKEKGKNDKNHNPAQKSNPSQGSNTDTKKQINWDLFKPHKQIYLVYKLVTLPGRKHLILPPLIAFSFTVYAFVGELTTTALYLTSEPLSFSPDFIGYYYASQGLIRTIGVIATTQIAHRVFKANDINVLLFGMLSQMTCYILIGSLRYTLAVFLSNLIGFGVPVALSLSRSYASKQVPPEQIGTLMAAFESLDALSFTTNLISLQIFNATLDTFSGSVFIFLGGCSLIGFCITLGNKFYLRGKADALPEKSNGELNEGYN